MRLIRLAHKKAEGVAGLCYRRPGMMVSFRLPLSIRTVVQHGLRGGGGAPGIVAKRFLAGEGIHYEPRWFKPGPQGVAGEVQLKESVLPSEIFIFDRRRSNLDLRFARIDWVANSQGKLAAM